MTKPRSFSLLVLAALSVGLSPTPSIAADQVIAIQIEKGRFNPSTIKIPANTKVKLIVKNLDDTPEEFESHDLNREIYINANSQASFYIGPLEKGQYQFEGEFSPETAQGVVIVQ